MEAKLSERAEDGGDVTMRSRTNDLESLLQSRTDKGMVATRGPFGADAKS
jgi:hypothetical protein